MPRHLVLDQNYLRFDGLNQLISDELDAIFILPDVALIEMCKGEKWHHVMRSSLAVLSKIPEKVKVSICVGEAIRKELASFKSIEGRLLHDDFTDFKNRILMDVADNTRSPGGVDLIAGKIDSAQKDFRDDELNHAKNQERNLKFYSTLKSELDAKLIKALRNCKISEDARLTIISELAQWQLQDFLLARGLSEERVSDFINQKPLLLRFYILLVQQGIEWIRIGGLESQPAERITNNSMDQDYVLIGSFFDALLSQDGKVVDADRDLRNCLSMPSQEWIDGPLNFDRFLPPEESLEEPEHTNATD